MKNDASASLSRHFKAKYVSTMRSSKRKPTYLNFGRRSTDGVVLPSREGDQNILPEIAEILLCILKITQELSVRRALQGWMNT